MPGICKKEDYFDSSMAVNVRQLIYNMIFQHLLSTYIIEIVRCTVVPNGRTVCLHQLANNAALCVDVPYFIILLCLTA